MCFRRDYLRGFRDFFFTIDNLVNFYSFYFKNFKIEVTEPTRKEELHIDSKTGYMRKKKDSFKKMIKNVPLFKGVKNKQTLLEIKTR